MLRLAAEGGEACSMAGHRRTISIALLTYTLMASVGSSSAISAAGMDNHVLSLVLLWVRYVWFASSSKHLRIWSYHIHLHSALLAYDFSFYQTPLLVCYKYVQLDSKVASFPLMAERTFHILWHSCCAYNVGTLSRFRPLGQRNLLRIRGGSQPIGGAPLLVRAMIFPRPNSLFIAC